MLRVDRDDLGTWGAPGYLNHGGGGDQGFLVGQSEAVTRLKRRQGNRQAGEANHTVDDDLGFGGDRDECLGSRKDLDPRGHPLRKLARQRRIRDGNPVGS